MNRHAVAFVSVFSLALVLSVYYIMIPKGKGHEGNGDGPVGGSVTEVSSARSYYFDALARERKDAYSEKIQNLETQLVTAATNEQKAELLAQIDSLENQFRLEQTVESKMEEFGYPLAYVKVDENEITVIVYESEPSDAKAAKIIRKILLETQKDLPVVLEFKS